MLTFLYSFPVLDFFFRVSGSAFGNVGENLLNSLRFSYDIYFCMIIFFSWIYFLNELRKIVLVPLITMFSGMNSLLEANTWIWHGHLFVLKVSLPFFHCIVSPYASSFLLDGKLSFFSVCSTLLQLIACALFDSSLIGVVVWSGSLGTAFQHVMYFFFDIMQCFCPWILGLKLVCRCQLQNSRPLIIQMWWNRRREMIL